MMSSILPRERPGWMSTSRTSVTPFSAMKNAALAPTLPPPTMLTWAMPSTFLGARDSPSANRVAP